MIVRFAALHESAFGPKQTRALALHMSAFGGKAGMALAPLCDQSGNWWS
jgi:hypothetical protein